MLTLADFRHQPDFAPLVRRIKALGGDHEMFGFDFVGGYALQQNPEELAALLLALLDPRPFDAYIEVGSAAGGTQRLLRQELMIRRALLIDDGSHPRAGELAANAGDATVLRADSHDPATWEFVEQWIDASYDDDGEANVLAFIDGDHSFQGARLDLALIEDACGEGTFVVMHDIAACDGVRRAWDAARDMEALAELIADDRPLGLGVGRIR